MEELARDENKDSPTEAELQALLQLQSKAHGEGNTWYIRRPHNKVREFELLERQELDQQIRTVEGAALVTVTPYVTGWIDDGTGHTVSNTEGKASENVIQLILTPKAEALLKITTTITKTETTIQKVFEPPEEPAWKENKRLRDFGRTERGCTIMMMSREALVSDVRSHNQAIRSGSIPPKDAKSHQMWLRHELARRWDEIPPDLRHEAEDCRDLQYARRRKRA